MVKKVVKRRRRVFILGLWFIAVESFVFWLVEVRGFGGVLLSGIRRGFKFLGDRVVG